MISIRRLEILEIFAEAQRMGKRSDRVHIWAAGITAMVKEWDKTHGVPITIGGTVVGVDGYSFSRAAVRVTECEHCGGVVEWREGLTKPLHIGACVIVQ